MIDILVDTAAIGQEVKDYIRWRIATHGYCSVDNVAHLSIVRPGQISKIGRPWGTVGWVKMPEITFRKDSEENFWRIQVDDPVLLSSFNTFKTECQNRLFFAKSPNDTWEPINEPIKHPIGTFTCDGFRGGKIYDVKTDHKEDMVDVMAYSNLISDEIKKWARKAMFEGPLTPKSIEQSADHKTVVVLWQDGSKTIVKLSDNDKDDIDTAFAYALAKKIFGNNTHLKKVVRQKLNEHKPRAKTLPSDPNPKEIPVEFEYIKAAKDLFLESHINYYVQIEINPMDSGETCVHMYNSYKGIIKYMKNVESTQEAISQLESMWQELNTEKEDK